MNFIFAAQKADIKDDLKDYAQKKVGKLDRYFKKNADTRIVFTEERGLQTAEITIHHGNMYFRASETTGDMRASIDQAVDAIVRQIHKNKTRLEKRLRTGAFEKQAGEAGETLPTVQEDSEYEIVKVKRFAVKPVTPEEAILQMNMLGHQFFAFKDSTNDEHYAVVYKRRDGAYGLIEMA